MALTEALSRLLVSCTVRADNAFEARMPHRTSVGGVSALGPGPWLTSLAMWENCLKHVPHDGITVEALEAAARAPASLKGMARWRYVNVDDGRVTLTRGGTGAQKVWRKVLPALEERRAEEWGERHTELRAALEDALPARAYPDYLPVVGWGLRTRGEWPQADTDPTGLPLHTLLSRVLLALADEYDEEGVPLAVAANVLRRLGDAPVLQRDLPRPAGVSKEGVSMALNFLSYCGYAEIGAAPGRGKQVTLTPEGHAELQRYTDVLPQLEADLDPSGALTAAAEAFTEEELLAACAPRDEDLWRAKVKAPQHLPAYPMVLHRGGFPDGA